MSKELAKFQGDYDKKIKPRLKALSKAQAAKLSKQISIALSNANEGETYLTECMVPAFKAGVNSTDVKDFMKVKEFKEGYTLFKKATEGLAQRLNDATAMQKAANAVVAEIGKLDAAITKDLKKRKDKSKTKTDIEALQKKLAADLKEIGDATSVYDKRNKYTKGYVAAFPKTVQQIVKTPPKGALDQKDATELPQMLQDRNLKTNTNKTVTAKKVVDAKCDAALKAAETDLKSAAKPLKEAAAAFKDMKKINDDYAKVLKTPKFKAMIDNSKDKGSIMKTLNAIAKATADSERKLRGISTTIKKAG